MKGLFSYACVILFLLCCRPVLAQDRWDQALDRYERICEECLRLRTLAAKGQTVPANDLSTLLAELSSLRQQLRQAEGSMSGRQQTRFQNIRQQYASMFSGGRRELASIPVGPEIPNPFQLKAWPLPPLRYVHRPATATLPQEPLQWSLVAFCGLPEGSIGLMGSVLKGGLGYYAKVSSTLSHRSSDGYCFSNGTLASGSYVWTSGQSSLSRLSVSAGILWRALPFAAIYAGAGYGFRRQLWQDVSGTWLEVSDLSAHGMAAEAGVQVPLGHLVLMAGASTIAFRSISADLGLGWVF